MQAAAPVARWSTPLPGGAVIGVASDSSVRRRPDMPESFYGLGAFQRPPAASLQQEPRQGKTRRHRERRRRLTVLLATATVSHRLPSDRR